MKYSSSNTKLVKKAEDLRNRAADMLEALEQFARTQHGGGLTAEERQQVIRGERTVTLELEMSAEGVGTFVYWLGSDGKRERKVFDLVAPNGALH